MIIKKYETRGSTAAVVESKITPTGDGALDAFLAKAEEAFVAGAEKHALASRDEMAKMSPRERRHALPTKITLSCETDGDTRVTLTASLVSGGVLREKKTSFYWDGESSFMSKKAKTRKNKKSREKL